GARITAPATARGRRSQISAGRISSSLDRGVHAMSDVYPIRINNGRAQKPARANPPAHTRIVFQPRFQNRTGTDANTTTIVVMMWQRAERPKNTAAQTRYRRSSRNPRIRFPRKRSEKAKDQEKENSPARVEAMFAP